MKNFKKVLSLLISLVLFAQVFSGVAYATEWGVINPGYISQDGKQIVLSGTDNPDYTLTWNNKTYKVLKAEANNGKTDFLVYRKDKIGTASTTDAKYDPTVSGSLAYYVNNAPFGTADATQATGYVSNHGTFVIDDTMKKYITEHTWLNENGAETSYGTPESYTITAKVVLPSLTEILEHHEKIGFDGISGTNSWTQGLILMRTGAYFGTAKHMAIVKDNGSNDTNTVGDAIRIKLLNQYQINIHPVFYISEDFFIENNVAGKIGGEVEDMLLENISARKMLTGGKYSEAELTNMGYDVENITPTLSVEKAVPGYRATVGNVPANAEITWYKSAAQNGEYALIEGASGNNWAIIIPQR